MLAILEVLKMIPMMIDDLYDKMPWDKIDTVVFDVGQVLLRFNPAELMQRIVPSGPTCMPSCVPGCSCPPTG